MAAVGPALAASRGAGAGDGRGAPSTTPLVRSAAESAPLLLHLLAGDLVTAGAVWRLINTADATALRLLHPLLPPAVAAVPWCDTTAPVFDVARWRTAFPAARGGRCVAPLRSHDGGSACGVTPAGTLPASAALTGLRVLHASVEEGGGRCLRGDYLDLAWLPPTLEHLLLCGLRRPFRASFPRLPVLVSLDCAKTGVGGGAVDTMPPSLVQLGLRGCRSVSSGASFAHLPALASLDCSHTRVGDDAISSLPPSLQVLSARDSAASSAARFARLRALRVLDCSNASISNATVASMPPSLAELDLNSCSNLGPGLTFAHLLALRALRARDTVVDDATVASLPPSLVELDVAGCSRLSRAASFAHLPALRVLDCAATSIGDACVASMPRSLVELRLDGCANITPATSLDHLRALRWLGNADVALSAAAVTACRDRGCFCPHVATLRGRTDVITSLALLPDGRLAGGDEGGAAQVWDVARSGVVASLLEGRRGIVHALAVLASGRSLAAGVCNRDGVSGTIVLWDISRTPPTRGTAVDTGRGGVWALAALPDGRLAAACGSDGLRVVDVAARAVVATLEGHTGSVCALALAPDGRLASASADTTVRVWNVARRACAATLVGHTGGARALAVLPDGRLASGADDRTVRLWDLDTRTCSAVLEGHTSFVMALAALPDGCLASGSADATIRVWDVRAAAGTVTATLKGQTAYVNALAPLPGGRLASASCDVVHVWQLPPLLRP